MINTKLQSIIDTKSAIGNAIVNKGGTITGETPFFNYAAQIDGISTGTPQTIFAASDGSKWALTNAVNLVNDAGNVTHDFNYWQPANNSTSDPILNIGTVGANISGNIQLVPVNQVNISQYVNLVATDTDGAKYEGFNGYDSQTNPTPTGNTTFNRWLLNNSASGTVIFANATFTTGIYNGPNVSFDESNLAFLVNSPGFGGHINVVTTNNGFVYAGGSTNLTVQKFHESNLVRTANSPSYGGIIQGLAANNGFVYAGGLTNLRVQKFHESNLAFNAQTSFTFGGQIEALKINNSFVYVAAAGAVAISKLHESNLVVSLNSGTISNASISKFVINNGSIFGTFGFDSFNPGIEVKKIDESTLNVVATANATFAGRGIAVNNGFVYASGTETNTVRKFYESNLAFVGNTASYGGTIISLTTKDGFIYAGGFGNTNRVQKFYESNLAFLANTVSYGFGGIRDIAINNGAIFAGGASSNLVTKFQQYSVVLDNQTFYTATKIKE
jgi:hypothetical protein